MNTLCGVAVLDSEANFEESFPLWWNKHKFKGMFAVRWLYVKNVDLTPLNMKEGQKKIYELHDGVELSRANGLTLLRHFKNYDNHNNVFNLFPILDVREDLITDYRKNLGFEIRLTKVSKENTPNLQYAFPAKKKHSFTLEDNGGGANYKNSWNDSDSEDDKWANGNHKGSKNIKGDQYNRKRSKSYNRQNTHDKKASFEYVKKDQPEPENTNFDLGLGEGIQQSIQ